MGARPRGRIGWGLAVTLVAIVGCATTQTPSPQLSQGPNPSATTSSSEPAPSTPTGELGTEPIGGPENQPTPVSHEPTSVDLVNAAVEAGKIDADTGLMYRIFASFADPRLPSEYASEVAELDHGSVSEAAYRLDSGLLPPAIADAVRPYLLRPTDPDSAFNDANSGSARRALSGSGSRVAPAAAQPACDDAGWSSLRSAKEPVKVWVRCSDPQRAGLLADAIAAAETLYAELSDDEMMGPAILDTGNPDTPAGLAAGGDNAIDIYISSRLACVNRDQQCKTLAAIDAVGMAPSALPRGGGAAWTSSAFVVIDRAEADAPSDLWSTMAHELFHVFEFAHNLGGMFVGDEYHWFVEASAAWAEQSFVPEGRADNSYKLFNTFQTALVGLTSVDGSNEYDSFVWPYFMEQKAGYRSVGDAWRALEGKVGFEQANVALASVFSFEKHYKDFAVQALNARLDPGDPAAPAMQVPDASFPKTGPEWATSALEDKKGSVLGALAGPFTLSVNVPPLAMRYHFFGVAGFPKQLVIDFTGVQPSQALDAEALLHIRKKGWERRPLSDGKTTFCLDRPEDDVDGAILVIANHSWVPKEVLTGPYTIKPSPDPCSESPDLHLGGRITWNATTTERLGITENVSGTADVVIHVVTSSLLVAERDDHSTYNYEYTSVEDPPRCPVSVESGTLESQGGTEGGPPTDYSIGTLNVGGRLGEDLYLHINMPDYCGPARLGNVGTDYYAFQGFPDCALNSQIIAKFDGVDSYVIDCDVVAWGGSASASGHISGVLRIIDGPHPTPRP